MNIYRPLAATAAALIVGFGLTGCFGNPLEMLAQDGIESIIEQQTGADIEIDTDGTGASLPKGLPDDIPIVDGRVISSFSTADIWTFQMQVDSIARAQDGYQKLLDSGFTEVSSLDMGEGNVISSAESDEYLVSYSWSSDQEGGFYVSYSVSVKE